MEHLTQIASEFGVFIKGVTLGRSDKFSNKMWVLKNKPMNCSTILCDNDLAFTK